MSLSQYHNALRNSGWVGIPNLPPPAFAESLQWLINNIYLTPSERQALDTLREAHKRLRQPANDWKELVEGLR